MCMVKSGDVVQLWVEDYNYTRTYKKHLHKKLFVVRTIGTAAIDLERIRPGKLYYAGERTVIPRTGIRLRKIDINEASDNLAAWMMRQALGGDDA